MLGLCFGLFVWGSNIGGDTYLSEVLHGSLERCLDIQIVGGVVNLKSRDTEKKTG